MNRDLKVGIVGAGIQGVSNALFLQKKGFNVTIFDRDNPGSQAASYGNAGHFSPYASLSLNRTDVLADVPAMLLSSSGPLALKWNYVPKMIPWFIKFIMNTTKSKMMHTAKNMHQILDLALPAYDELFEELDLEGLVENKGILYIWNDKDLKSRELEIKVREELGVKQQLVNKKEIHDLEPNLAPVYYSGQLFVGSRHTTNPLAISNKIFESFLKLGGQYIRDEVKNVKQNENSVDIFLSDKKLEFDEMVLCAGAWSNSIAKMVGENFPLDTERGYHVLFETDKQLINRPIAWSESGFYLIQINEGVRAAGTVEIAGLNKPPNYKRTQMIERQSRKILPQLGKVISTWMGRRPTLPDAMPIIGKSIKNKNIIYAFGHQHIGWTLAAVTGRVIDELVKGSQPNFDISPFKPDRFK